jgi:hypothetical protein
MTSLKLVTQPDRSTPGSVNPVDGPVISAQFGWLEEPEFYELPDISEPSG